MAFAELWNRRILVCAICHQQYKRPKALPCLHTFCEKCLQEYVSGRYRDSKVFQCPTCSQDINLPSEGVAGFIDNTTVDQPLSLVTSSNDYSDGSENDPLLPHSKSGDATKQSKHARLSKRFGSFGLDANQFLSISGLAISSQTNEIVVADCSLNKISIFALDGVLRTSFFCDCSIRDVAVTKENTILATVSRAEQAILREYSMEGVLVQSYKAFNRRDNPFGIAITGSSKPVITSPLRNCVHILSDTKKLLSTFGSRGRGANHFDTPYYIAANARDDIIISDSGNHRIKVHRTDGTFISSFGCYGNGKCRFFYPMGVCTDGQGNIYVADANNYRIQMFTPQGDYVASPVENTHKYGEDVKPVLVEFMHEDLLIVAYRGTRFSEIHIYIWNESNKSMNEEKSCMKSLCCCSSPSNDDL